MGTVVVAFDVDGTLTVRDCVVPFLIRLAGGRAALARGLARQPRDLLTTGIHRDRDRAKAIATRAAMHGLAAARVADEGRAFAGVVAASWMRADTTARLSWHRAQGHRVVLVSASYEAYVTPLAGHLDADAALATRLEVGPDGRLTGGLLGPNCRADEKVVRLRDWQLANDLADATVWAYGDSAGDDAMLAVADHPVRVGAAPISTVPGPE